MYVQLRINIILRHNAVKQINAVKQNLPFQSGACDAHHFHKRLPVSVAWFGVMRFRNRTMAEASVR
jgi:hypothetical protein